MPTQSNAGALLILGSTADLCDPWSFETWQLRTGLELAPWASDVLGIEKSDIVAFVNAFHNPANRDKVEFMRQKDDFDAGRKAWQRWTNERWEKVHT